jgi:hypothetical protein
MAIVYLVCSIIGSIALGFILGYKGYKNWPLGYILAPIWPLGIFVALLLPAKKARAPRQSMRA